jgi:hypothetical protein
LLITLFTPPVEAESILGDLLEEFADLARKSGIAFARRWYWRQTAKSITHLIGTAFRTAPATFTAVVVGGFLLRWFISWVSDPAIKGAIDTVLSKYGYYEDPLAYVFWLTNGILFTRLIVNALVGAVVAMIAKGREMAATTALALLGDVLAIYASLLTLVNAGDAGVLWTLPSTFLLSIAIVVAGAIVRIRRSDTTARLSAT